VLVEDGGHGVTTAAPIARRMLRQFFRLNVNDIDIGSGGGSTD